MSWLVRIYRCSIACLLYLSIKIGLPLVMHFGVTGYKRSVVGTCTILAPPKQMQIILEGTTYLRDIDPEMFRRLTAERKYFLSYHKKHRTSFKEFYTITDNGLLHGKEGVVICLVQIILIRDVKDSLGRFRINSSEEIAARRDYKQQIFEFVKRHSFSPKLVDHYQKLAG